MSSGRAFSIDDTSAVGNAGDLNITTEKLIIRDDGLITASSLGIGQGGNININIFDFLILESEASILAETGLGEGGNINLKIENILSLDNNSLISAQAFDQANGGNLTIDTTFIIAFSNGNSDIVAGAEQGQGGNITINAESLLGIEERPLNPFSNDINASSQISGLDGTVEISIPDINPIQGTTELPTNKSYPNRQ